MIIFQILFTYFEIIHQKGHFSNLMPDLTFAFYFYHLYWQLIYNGKVNHPMHDKNIAEALFTPHP